MLLACNTSADKNLIPHLVTNNMVGFLFDMRQSIYQETANQLEVAVETEINIAQALSKIFIRTNPVLIQDSQLLDAIKLMISRLLNPSTHHELLIYESLLALINISVCLQGGDLKYVDSILKAKCGD